MKGLSQNEKKKKREKTYSQEQQCDDCGEWKDGEGEARRRVGINGDG